VGTRELIEDIAREIVEKAEEVGVDVMLQVSEHLQYVYPIFDSYDPEERNSLIGLYSSMD
jgi:predicted RNA-binding protein YlqC (UPF0109 family)